MRIIQSVLLALALTLSTSVFAQVQLKLKAGVAQNFGVATELLKGTAQASTYTLDARVLDPSSLYSQTDELQASNSALALSSAQAARVGRLYRNQQNATQAALAQATLTALNDQKMYALAQTALRTSWGDAVAGWSTQERARRVLELRAGRASLVRAELDAALSSQAEFSSADIKLELIGLLPQADPQTGRAGALLWLTRSLPALSRVPINVRAQGALAAATAVLIPRSAILRLNGGSFVFIQTADDRYSMRELNSPERSTDGWLVQSGFAVGERIVTAGAASLLTLARGAGAEDDE